MTMLWFLANSNKLVTSGETVIKSLDLDFRDRDKQLLANGTQSEAEISGEFCSRLPVTQVTARVQQSAFAHSSNNMH